MDVVSIVGSWSEEDVVVIADQVFVKHESALHSLLAHLRKTGFTVKDNREDPNYTERATVEQMQTWGWSMWEIHPHWIKIYETWHWSPLSRSSLLCQHLCHVGQIYPDPTYSDPDMLPVTPRQRENIVLFVKHFAAINLDEFMAAESTFRYMNHQYRADLVAFCGQ